MPRRSPKACPLAVAIAAAVCSGCVFTPPPPLPGEEAERDAAAEARAAAVQSGKAGAPDGSEGEAVEAAAPTFAKGDPPALGMTPDQMKAYATAQGDPEAGDFTLAEALDGIPPSGTLVAILHTTSGAITCELLEQQTPLTVANFVGLSRGRRPTLDPDTGEWTQRRFYDGVQFHRVIPGFMIQGGDPTGTGRGETGYVIPDELRDELAHDRAGILSMANRGPGTGNAQFFVTLGPAPHLDGRHTVFGVCDEASVDVAEHIAALRGAGDRPTTPQVIDRVEIVRR